MAPGEQRGLAAPRRFPLQLTISDITTFNPKSFSEPDRLKTIEPSRLRAFLAPYETYLCYRGFTVSSDGAIDYDALAQLLMHPDDQAARHGRRPVLRGRAGERPGDGPADGGGLRRRDQP